MAKPRLYADRQTIRFNMIMLKDHYDELQKLACYEGKSAAGLIREIIAKELKDREAVDAEDSQRR